MIDGLLKGVDGILDKFIPDADTKLKLENEIMRLAASNADKQTEVNKEEAKHGSVFVAGARPFLLWVCGAAFAMNFVVMPFLTAFAPVFGWGPLAVVALDWGQMMPVLMGMLGLGGMRSWEKSKGIHRNSISNKITDAVIDKFRGNR